MAKNEKSSQKSIQDAVNSMSKILKGIDNTSIQAKKANSMAQEKLEKIEQQQEQLRNLLGGITNNIKAGNAALPKQSAERKKDAPAKVSPKTINQPKDKKPAQNKQKPVQTSKNHVPVRDLINSFLAERTEAYAKDIFNFVQSKQPTSRASVYQTLKKYFSKKGEGVDAVYSKNMTEEKVDGRDETESYLSMQFEKEKDLTIS